MRVPLVKQFNLIDESKPNMRGWRKREMDITTSKYFIKPFQNRAGHTQCIIENKYIWPFDTTINFLINNLYSDLAFIELIITISHSQCFERSLEAPFNCDILVFLTSSCNIYNLDSLVLHSSLMPGVLLTCRFLKEYSNEEVFKM